MQKEIFLVADSSDFRQMVRSIFAQFLPEYNIRSFKGAQELYKYMIFQSDENFKGRRPALIMLDLHMPMINGLEVLKMLRKTPSNAVTQWATIPVIMLSDIDRPEDVNKCYQAGATSFVIKPLEFEELKHLLIKICNYWLDHNKLAVTSNVSAARAN
jgi:CheY-like chemotaxis protein